MNEVKERAFLLRFVSSMDPHRSFTFPCNAQGEVDKNRMPSQALQNYERAVAEVGKTFLFPVVNKI